MDLNLFICDEGCQVFWDDRSCANANLDVDDRDGGGPETITLNSQMPAPLDQTYVAWVCNFIIFFYCTLMTNPCITHRQKDHIYTDFLC